jgi:ABC-type nitrate/sulfonate/bicarbonate transport system substrate-binding protein
MNSPQAWSPLGDGSSTMQTRASRRSVLASAGAALLGTAVSSTARAEGQTITLFVGTTPDYANIYVARDKGFLEAEGLKLDVRLFPSGSAATDAFRSGKVELVAAGDIPAMRLWDATGARIIAPTGFDGFTPVFMTKSTVKGPEDLPGKTFGTRIGSSAELLVEGVRQKYSLAPDAFKMTNLEPPDMVAALDGGDIDGFFWYSPFEERSLQISGSKVRLFMRGDEVGVTNEVAMCARADVIDGNPDMLVRFLRGLIKGSDYAMTHPDETVDIVAAALKLDKKAAEVIKHMQFPLAFDHRVYDRYGTSSKFMVTKGWLKQPADFDKCFWIDGIAKVDPKRIDKPEKT